MRADSIEDGPLQEAWQRAKQALNDVLNLLPELE